MHADIALIYESASTAMPFNEEYANHWFMALVRTDRFKDQQMLAMKLQKQFKTQPKYYFWAVISIYLQLKALPESNRAIMATLAERMMVKAAEEKRLTNFEGNVE
jgi:N-terminal acetyltransferase B complex non-catalytic subunit